MKTGVPDILVCTRFGLRIKERAWFIHRMALISSITAPSLMAQQDQSFRWAILVDDQLPSDIREDLEELLQPFGDRAFLDQRPFHTPESLVELARDRRLSDKSPYLVTARIDDDDAWSTMMVGAVRQRVAKWLEQPSRAPGLSLTFQDGLEWVMYEMLDVEKLHDHGERFVHLPAIRRYCLPFHSMSVFVCSLFSDEATAMSGAHSRVAEKLGATKGFATEVIPTDSPMWLYCRHKQAGSGIKKATGDEIPVNLPNLAGQFGLDQQRLQSYLDQVDDHQYALVKSPIARKRKLLVDLVHVNQKIEDSAASDPQLSELHRQRAELTAEVTRLEVDVLGVPQPGSDR